MFSLEFPCFLHDPKNAGNLILGSSASWKPSLFIWKFSIHELMPSLKDFEHNLASMWNEHSGTVVWTFVGIVLLRDGNENWLFPVLWPLLDFPYLLTYWVQHWTAWSFRIWNSSAGIPSLPLALFEVMLPKAHLTSNSRMSGCRWVNTIMVIWLIETFLV